MLPESLFYKHFTFFCISSTQQYLTYGKYLTTTGWMVQSANASLCKLCKLHKDPHIFSSSCFHIWKDSFFLIWIYTNISTFLFILRILYMHSMYFDHICPTSSFSVLPGFPPWSIPNIMSFLLSLFCFKNPLRLCSHAHMLGFFEPPYFSVKDECTIHPFPEAHDAGQSDAIRRRVKAGTQFVSVSVCL